MGLEKRLHSIRLRRCRHCNKLSVWQEDKDHYRVKQQFANLHAKHAALVKAANDFLDCYVHTDGMELGTKFKRLSKLIIEDDQ